MNDIARHPPPQRVHASVHIHKHCPPTAPRPVPWALSNQHPAHLLKALLAHQGPQVKSTWMPVFIKSKAGHSHAQGLHVFVIAGQSQEAAAATRRPVKLGTPTLWPFTERLQAPHLPQMLSAVPQGPPQWPVPCSALLCLPSCLCILQALPGAFPSEASVARQGGLPKSTVCSDEEPHHSLRRRRNGRPFGLRLCRSPLRLPKGELLAGGRCPGHVSGGGRWLAHSSAGVPGTPED